MTNDPFKTFMADRTTWRGQINSCVDKGVRERPPVSGTEYKAFIVHEADEFGRRRRNALAVSIGHYDADQDKIIVDVIRADIDIDDWETLSKRYGNVMVCGAIGDKSDALSHATAGVISMLKDKLKVPL